MKKYFFLLILLFSVNGFSAPSGKGTKWSVTGFYGMGFINPTDLNANPAFASTTPRPKNLTSSTIYGGTIGYNLSSKFRFSVMYDSQSSKEPTRLTSPSISNGGFEVTQNNIWGKLDYYFKTTGNLHLFVGAAAGYPLYSHVTLNLSSKTEYDAEKSLVSAGFLGANFNFSKNIGLFLQAGYQNSVMSVLKTSNGTRLTKTGGGNAQLNLSGAIGHAGLAIMF